ncbi:hypothetical protein MYX07_04040 [Patescibacteria group bacterium AH-259-L07]|nr:hypothetical protein [Patescibacteria group bacterium AH-259-L07]
MNPVRNFTNGDRKERRDIMPPKQQISNGVKKTSEQDAEQILKEFTHLKTKKFYRPFVIEITGTPVTGKTSIRDALTRFFIRAGWRVNNPAEGAEITKKIPRTTHLYNIRTGIYALSELLDNIYSLDFDLLLFDRAIYDAFCWQEYWLRKKVISNVVADAAQKFFSQPEILKQIDLCFFITCEPKEAMRREAEWAVTEKHSETTNPESIENLITIWQDCYKAFNKSNNPVALLDTTDMNPQKMGNAIVLKTIKAMKKRLAKIKS